MVFNPVRGRGAAVAFIACVATGGVGHAQCPPDEAVVQLAAGILAAKPEIATTGDALCGQGKLVPLLAREWARPWATRGG